MLNVSNILLAHTHTRITNNKSKIRTYVNRPVDKLCPLEITSKQSEKENKIRFVNEKTIPKMNIE